MITLLSHFVLLLSTSHSNLVDTIPSCIAYMKTETGTLLTKYEYKGQHWYALRPSANKVIDNNSDKMTTIAFYDSTCHVVGYWTKGGIAGLNRITPDSIQKEKIKLLWTEKDSTKKKNTTPKTPVLSDTIAKMSVAKGATWIEETSCKEDTLYRFENKKAVKDNGVRVFDGLYYNKEGKAVPEGTGCLTRYWWHMYNGKFSRTQFRPGYR
jgi:hypothetical protein